MYSGFCWQYEQLNRKMCVQKKLCIQDVTLFLHQISVSMSNVGKTKNLKALTDNSLALSLIINTVVLENILGDVCEGS